MQYFTMQTPDRERGTVVKKSRVALSGKCSKVWRNKAKSKEGNVARN